MQEKSLRLEKIVTKLQNTASQIRGETDSDAFMLGCERIGGATEV